MMRGVCDVCVEGGGRKREREREREREGGRERVRESMVNLSGRL